MNRFALLLLLFGLSPLSLANDPILVNGDFHWLRPTWLLGIIPALLVALWLWRQHRQAHQWENLIAPELLPHLLDGKSLKPASWSLLALAVGWIIACLALAGPTWEKRSLPVEKNQHALLILLDLSPSMLSEDLKPSRLVRARLKLIDILRERRDGLTGLLVYAGDAHAVIPLTDDTATIQSLVPALHPDLMPKRGSNIEAAIARAIDMMADSGVREGELLLITDGVDESALGNIRGQLQNTRYRLSVLGVGGDVPAPIPSARGNFVRDAQGEIVTTYLDEAPLRRLADQSGGRYARLASDARDTQWLLSQTPVQNEESARVQRDFDNWYDRGHWLVFLLLPLVLYCFRRGLLVVALCIPASLLYTPQSQAFSWNDLWFTRDQQGQQALEAGDAATAAERFEDPQWRASAQYQAGDFEAAAESFAQLDTAAAHYNRGNALARSGKLQEAIAAYDKALLHQPEFPEASDNRELVKQLLDQQQQSDNQNQQQDSEQEDSDQQQESGQQDAANPQQNPDEQSSEQESQDSDSQNESEPQSQQGQQEAQEDEAPVDQEQSPATEDSDSETENDQEQQEQQSTDETDNNNEEEGQERQTLQLNEEDNLSDEERQALEQWLRRVPDDPGGLLRNKFRHQHQQMQRQGRHALPDSRQEERW